MSEQRQTMIYTGYALRFNEPDSNGNVILASAFDAKDFDKMKESGNIMDYQIDNIGVMIMKTLTK